jgi:orotidine-5'-phosphate decarboxylase
MVNVHASGGRRMLEAAREAIDTSAHSPLLIAVTVLTSMTKEDLLSVGLDVEPEEQVMRLAALSKLAGLDGVVCSAMEAEMLKSALGKDFCLVTPGIRPANAAADDQRRIVTPQDAMKNGSDYLVIGRPITQAENPAQVCESIYQSLSLGS